MQVQVGSKIAKKVIFITSQFSLKQSSKQPQSPNTVIQLKDELTDSNKTLQKFAF